MIPKRDRVIMTATKVHNPQLQLENRSEAQIRDDLERKRAYIEHIDTLLVQTDPASPSYTNLLKSRSIVHKEAMKLKRHLTKQEKNRLVEAQGREKLAALMRVLTREGEPRFGNLGVLLEDRQLSEEKAFELIQALPEADQEEALDAYLAFAEVHS